MYISPAVAPCLPERCFKYGVSVFSLVQHLPGACRRRSEGSGGNSRRRNPRAPQRIKRWELCIVAHSQQVDLRHWLVLWRVKIDGWLFFYFVHFLSLFSSGRRSWCSIKCCWQSWKRLPGRFLLPKTVTALRSATRCSTVQSVCSSSCRISLKAQSNKTLVRTSRVLTVHYNK